MNGYSKTAGGFILALMVAVAFTGAEAAAPIGIKMECQDGIDQDNDGSIDENDDNCWEYPFADGGGEYATTFGPTGKGFNSGPYEMTVFDWHNQVNPVAFVSGGLACFSPEYEPVYQQIDSNSNGEDASLDQWNQWMTLNCN